MTSKNFHFRDIHPHILIGTASDRYAGWCGQIYSPEKYQGRTNKRLKNLGGKSFIEEVLPVDSVQEYFEHFPVLEIDFTFYRLILDDQGRPTANHDLLLRYKENLKDNDRLILKVPQIIMARQLRQGKSIIPNTAYLNGEIFTRQFYEPAVAILGQNLKGFIFEQEYQRSKDRVPVELFSENLDVFFRSIPSDCRYHVEIRTPAYLTAEVFKVLKSHEVGQVLSQWTWLEPLKTQFTKSGEKIFNSNKEIIIRLLTPFKMRYEETYALAHPFDKLVDGLFNPKIIQNLVDMIREILKQEAVIYLIINNRVGGSAPLIAEMVAEKILA